MPNELYAWFNEYYEKRGYLHLKQNRARAKERIFNYFESVRTKENLSDLDSKVKNNKQLSLLLIDYYKYIKKHYGFDYDSDLIQIYSYDTIDRQLEIAKFLHNNPTKADILDKFGISDRTLDNDLDALRQGITLQKNTVKLNLSENNRHFHCESTVHPIFLPLNLTEVFALTKTLPTILKKSNRNTEEYELILEIIERIKHQLSDYALEKLFNQEEVRNLKQKEFSLSFNEEESLLNETEFSSNTIIYYIKHNIKCKFMIKNEVIEGVITGDFNIKTRDGQTIEVDSISSVLLGPVE